MQLVYLCGRCSVVVQQVQTGKDIGKQSLNKLDMRSVWQIPLCSTMQKNAAEAEFTETTLLWLARVEHWTGWARLHLASTPCENHVCLVLGITLNATLSLLHRIVSIGTNSDGWRYVRVEPDIRHAGLVLRDLGLEGSKVKPLTTPGFKLDEREVALRETEVPLEATVATRYRSCVMRLSHFSQDRADLGEPVKCLARSMAKPTPGSLRYLKKVARYLLGTKYIALHLLRQTFPNSISTYVDSDFAGCRSTRKSTTGMVQMVGEHPVKHTSNLQGATGLNVSECEYYALTHGAAHGLGLKAYMADLGFEMSLQIFSDSSAAKLSHYAEDWDVSDTCKHASCGFRSESLQHISKYRRLELHRTQPTFSLTQQAEKHWRNTERRLDSDRSKHIAARRSSDLESLDRKKTVRFEPAAIHLCRESARG